MSLVTATSRNEEPHSAIESWIEDLSELVDKAQASEEFQALLDV